MLGVDEDDRAVDVRNTIQDARCKRKGEGGLFFSSLFFSLHSFSLHELEHRLLV